MGCAGHLWSFLHVIRCSRYITSPMQLRFDLPGYTCSHLIRGKSIPDVVICFYTISYFSGFLRSRRPLELSYITLALYSFRPCIDGVIFRDVLRQWRLDDYQINAINLSLRTMRMTAAYVTLLTKTSSRSSHSRLWTASHLVHLSIDCDDNSRWFCHRRLGIFSKDKE